MAAALPVAWAVPARAGAAPATGTSAPAPIVVYGVGGKPLPTAAFGHPLPASQLLPTGVGSAEPTIGLTSNGDIFVNAGIASNDVDVLRSTDQGHHWTNVAAGTGTHPASLDPYLYVDERTSRVFNLDAAGACSYLTFSDTDGASWAPNPACVPGVANCSS